VEKFVGDAVMAVFGAPVAHEDDAERAVRARLRILGAIGELNAADPALELQVRVGINTGEAVVALGARPELGEDRDFAVDAFFLRRSPSRRPRSRFSSLPAAVRRMQFASSQWPTPSSCWMRTPGDQ
jgi:class 3 adenylate cyclase